MVRTLMTKIDCEKLDRKTVMTIPNKALTIQDILDRFIRKIPVPEYQEVFIPQDENDDSIDFEKLHKADLVDKEYVAMEMKARAEAARTKIDKARKPKAEATSNNSGNQGNGEPKGEPEAMGT